jgi:hypothetical protein
MRLVGGALQGQVMWVEPDASALDIHMGGQTPGATRVLHYRRSGAVLRFAGETTTGPAPTGGMPT